MEIKQHLRNTFQLNSERTPIFKMVLSSLSVTIPLLIGYLNNHLFISMIGALMGLLIYLNDTFGSYSTRIKHLALAFIFFNISFVVGAYSAGHNTLIIILLFILSFCVGKSKDYGIELEKIMLFVTLQFLTASSSSVFKTELISIFRYSAFAFFNYLTCISIIFIVFKHQTSPVNSKREALKKIISQNKTLQFPLVCASFSCLGYLATNALKFSHPYWIIGTYLIVFLPDSYRSIYKSGQRIIGTIIGVVLSSVILTYIHDARILMIFVFIFAFLMPDGISKNYWVGNVYIAALIMLLLELAIPNSTLIENLGYWRIVDIGIGSLLGILASIWIKPEIITGLIKKYKSPI